MAKFKRQPKAGELALRTSARFSERPREIMATAPLYQPRTESRENTDISLWRHKITFCNEGAAYGARDTWQRKGGMTGGAGGSTRGVTSCNGSGVVPQAFVKPY